MDPLLSDFRLDEFDLSLLDVETHLLQEDVQKLRSAIQKYLGKMLQDLPGEWHMTPHEEHVSVMWSPKSSQDMDAMMDLVAGMIRQRAFAVAEPLLRTLLRIHPNEPRLLFNMGILLSEKGSLNEARELLKKLTRAAPDVADGWNALGVVLSKSGRRKEAAGAFQKSLNLDPDNGQTLRNLGALRAIQSPPAALPPLKRAATALPSDQSAQYLYGDCLANTGDLLAADRVLKKAIALNTQSEVADLCREARLNIKRSQLKPAVPRGLRKSVVAFCLEALETFEEIGLEGTKGVVFDIASVASSGLDINDRTSRYRILSLPGQFSALQLVVYLYVGMKKTAPRTDAGINFSREYEFALAYLQEKKRSS